MAEVAPVVVGPFCGSDALIWTPPRAFGARFRNRNGLRVQTALAMPTMDAAISNANPVRMPAPANCSAIRSLGFLFNAWSCQALGHFIVVSAKGDIVFP